MSQIKRGRCGRLLTSADTWLLLCLTFVFSFLLVAWSPRRKSISTDCLRELNRENSAPTLWNFVLLSLSQSTVLLSVIFPDTEVAGDGNCSGLVPSCRQLHYSSARASKLQSPISSSVFLQGRDDACLLPLARRVNLTTIPRKHHAENHPIIIQYKTSRDLGAPWVYKPVGPATKSPFYEDGAESKERRCVLGPWGPQLAGLGFLQCE